MFRLGDEEAAVLRSQIATSNSPRNQERGGNRSRFNLMHYGSGVKVDLIVRKSSEYRALEFARRLRVALGAIETWIVSREDLILSKLVWASDSASELQRRDVRQLLGGPVDVEYLRKWAAVLGVESALEDVQR